MKKSGWVPCRGDIVWLEFTPHSGRGQAGRRPALVLSPVEYNGKTGLLIACPITSKAKGYPFEVALPPDIGVTGVILSDQIKSLDWKVRKAGYECGVPDEVTDEVLAKAYTLLS